MCKQPRGGGGGGGHLRPPLSPELALSDVDPEETEPPPAAGGRRFIASEEYA